MSANILNELGTIQIDEEVFRKIASEACMKTFGVTGLAYRSLSDGLLVFLKKEYLSRGVKIITKNNKLKIELTVILDYGVRIPLVCENIMEQVAYDIFKKTGILVDEIDIVVQSVSLLDEVQ